MSKEADKICEQIDKYLNYMKVCGKRPSKIYLKKKQVDSVTKSLQTAAKKAGKRDWDKRKFDQYQGIDIQIIQ